MAEITRARAGQIVRAIFGVRRRSPDESGSDERPQDPAESTREASRHTSAQKRARTSDTDGVEQTEVPSRAAAIVDDATALAWSEIAAHLRAMPPRELQELVASLLGAMGYRAPWVAPPGKEGGLDIVAFTDSPTGHVERIKVRVMPVATGRVGAAHLLAFVDMIDVRDVGLFVALDGFSADAEAEASGHEAHRITLLDLAGLFDLWVEHYDRLPAEGRRLLPLRPVHFLDPQQRP